MRVCAYVLGGDAATAGALGFACLVGVALVCLGTVDSIPPNLLEFASSRHAFVRHWWRPCGRVRLACAAERVGRAERDADAPFEEGCAGLAASSHGNPAPCSHWWKCPDWSIVTVHRAHWAGANRDTMLVRAVLVAVARVFAQQNVIASNWSTTVYTVHVFGCVSFTRFTCIILYMYLYCMYSTLCTL